MTTTKLHTDTTKTTETEKLLKQLLKENNSRTLKTLTDDEWQECLHILRTITPTTTEKRLKRKLGRVVLGKNWTLSGGEEFSLDKYYTQFINDVLKVIRSGEIDYCFYTYQIAELLRFEPNLQARLTHDDCSHFEVWLNRY